MPLECCNFGCYHAIFPIIMIEHPIINRNHHYNWSGDCSSWSSLWCNIGSLIGVIILINRAIIHCNFHCYQIFDRWLQFSSCLIVPLICTALPLIGLLTCLSAISILVCSHPFNHNWLFVWPSLQSNLLICDHHCRWNQLIVRPLAQSICSFIPTRWSSLLDRAVDFYVAWQWLPDCSLTIWCWTGLGHHAMNSYQLRECNLVSWDTLVDGDFEFMEDGLKGGAFMHYYNNDLQPKQVEEGPWINR